MTTSVSGPAHRTTHRTALRLGAAALTASSLVALPAGLGAAAHAATATCHGQAATIVGTRGQELDGTTGADVIVSNGASRVFPNGGQDLVCLTGSPGGTVTVYAIGGGLTIDATASTAPVDATVGGATTYTGGARPDTVAVYSNAAQPDSVSTGGGADAVTIGDYNANVGAPEPTSADRVDLGSGNDQVFVDSPLAGGSIGGGSGRDTVQTYAPAAHDWRVDFAAQRLTVGGSDSMTGFEALGGFTTWSSLAVVGSNRPETVELDDLFSGSQGPIDLRLGGGNDNVSASRNLRGSVNGGSGNNVFTTTRSLRLTDKPLHLALRAGNLSTAGRTLRVHGFHHVQVKESVRATVLGTNAPDKLVVNACSATIKGLGGSDSLRFSLPKSSQCPHPPRVRGRLYGGPGNDGLSGTGGHDVLIGGPGRDHADGRGGGDRCLAERAVACGRRR